MNKTFSKFKKNKGEKIPLTSKQKRDFIIIAVICLLSIVLFWYLNRDFIAVNMANLSRFKNIRNEDLWSIKYIMPDVWDGSIPQPGQDIKNAIEGIKSGRFFINLFVYNFQYVYLFFNSMIVFILFRKTLNSRVIEGYKKSRPAKIYDFTIGKLKKPFGYIKRGIINSYNWLKNNKKVILYVLLIWLSFNGILSKLLIEITIAIIWWFDYSKVTIFFPSQIKALYLISWTKIKKINLISWILIFTGLYFLVAFRLGKKNKKKINEDLIEVVENTGTGTFVEGPVGSGKSSLLVALGVANYRRVIAYCFDQMSIIENRFFGKFDFKKNNALFKIEGIQRIEETWEFVERVIKQDSVDLTYRYNDFRNGLDIKRQLVLYYTCMYILYNDSYIASNFVIKYRPDLERTKDSEYKYSRILNLDAFRNIASEGKRPPLLQDGATYLIAEIDKDFDSDERTLVNAMEAHKVFSMSRHFLTLGVENIGRIFADAQIPTKVIKKVRGNFESTLYIEKTKTKMFWMIKPYKFVIDRMMKRSIKKKLMWETKREDYDFLGGRFNDFKLKYLQKISDYLNTYLFREYRVRVLSALDNEKDNSGKLGRKGILKIKYNIDEVYGFYETAPYQVPNHEEIKISEYTFDDLPIPSDVVASVKDLHKIRSISIDRLFEWLYKELGLEIRDWSSIYNIKSESAKGKKKKNDDEDE